MTTADQTFETLEAGRAVVEATKLIADYADTDPGKGFDAVELMENLGRIVDSYRRGDHGPHVRVINAGTRAVAICTGCESTFAGPKRRVGQSVFQHRAECEQL